MCRTRIAVVVGLRRILAANGLETSTMHPTIRLRALACAGLLALLAGGSLEARQGSLPYSLAHPAKAGVDVPLVDVSYAFVQRSGPAIEGIVDRFVAGKR